MPDSDAWRLLSAARLRPARCRDPRFDDRVLVHLRHEPEAPRQGPLPPLRVRRLAGTAEAAALHGQLLPDGDALHPLRHRDRLSLPARDRASKRPLAKAGLKSERLLWPTKKGVFEEEVESMEDALGLTTLEKAVA